VVYRLEDLLAFDVHDIADLNGPPFGKGVGAVRPRASVAYRAAVAGRCAGPEWLTSRGLGTPACPTGNGGPGRWCRREIVRRIAPCVASGEKRRGSRRYHRYAPTVTHLLGPPMALVDAASFLWTYQDVFQRGIYAFRTASGAPVHHRRRARTLVLSVIYFKRLYPASEIVAFEPDPNLFAILQRNVRAHGYADVEPGPPGAVVFRDEAGFLARRCRRRAHRAR
jgi:hypothetical protein